MKIDRAQMHALAAQCPGGDPCQRCAPPVRVVRVHLHMPFLLADLPSTIRWTPLRPVIGATVQLGDSAVMAISDARGVASLSLGQQSGDFVLIVTPAAGQACAEPAGPAIASPDWYANPPIMHRPFVMLVRLDAEGFVATPPPQVFAGVPGVAPHARVREVAATDLKIDWKPDWVRAAHTRRMAVKSKQNDCFVIHHTGEISVGSTINTFTNPTVNNDNPATSAHYLLDLDGHLVKLVHESEEAYHAGSSLWQGAKDLNNRSIGVEIVHEDKAQPGRPFTDEQYTTLARLLYLVRGVYPAITRQRTFGHCDCRVKGVVEKKPYSYTLSVNRQFCPGNNFDWPRLEALGLARRPRPVVGIERANLYGGFFDRPDAAKRAAQSGPHVAELKRDLMAIGYSIAAADGITVTESHDEAFRRAIIHFQMHYFSGSRLADRPAPIGTLDLATALMIRAVRLDSGP